MRVVALYRRGARWDAAAPLGERLRVRDHIAFLTGLASRGIVVQAGPFTPLSEPVARDLVGLVVLRAAGIEEAEHVLAEDPALREDVMRCELHAWFTAPDARQ